MKNIIQLYSSFCFIVVMLFSVNFAEGSSHREAPLISNDPLADNVDLYAFRSPDSPGMITIIATYIPMQLPHGGPNYYTFGENIRYEIHVDNDANISGDEVTYRFTFNQVNEDPTTFFNIRLGAQNLKTTYTLERSLDGGISFQTIVENGIVPPNNIGKRSIEGAAGLNTTYDALFQGAITQATTGETVFAGPTDDPFFVDLGGIFDLGDAPRQDGDPRDALKCYNVSALAIQVPISTLLKAGAPQQPTNILDSDYVVGVWASASRPSMTTLSSTENPSYSGDWVQVSRLGMPLTNEAVIPIGSKDFWNSITPYQELAEATMDQYFYNPELALYMDDDLFGAAVPALGPLRIQTNSLGAFDFSNGADGLYGLKGTAAVQGTALDDAVFGTLLLPNPGQPRSVDLWPAFHTGVPNFPPYQLATGKDGNPLAVGKPFVNNFLPNGGDMLRLNMAVPPTPRDDPNFSSLGLIQAAAIGLTVAPFNTTADLEFIPNMDGFPNGRRLEDDVTRIELQAVAGVVLAAVGLWYDDYDPASSTSPVTQDLLNVLTYSTGVEENDVPFTGSFPYLAQPFSGTGNCSGEPINVDVASLGRLFASSNNTGTVGVYDIWENNNLQLSTFPANGTDADGIYYDENRDLLYQLNRTDNVINVYGEVNGSVQDSDTPPLVATSTSDFINGREIAVTENWLVVAQDANEANNMTNKFYIYDISATTPVLVKIYDANINLWGIHADGDRLYAIEDNSNRLAFYDDFYNQPAGAISPSGIISVEGIVRTHGLTYDFLNDVMYLTDVGAASSPDDGAFVVINNFLEVSDDNLITASESRRVSGDNTFLGNPVDIAFSPVTGDIFIAERANGGGRILGFTGDSDGNVMPMYNELFAGASAVMIYSDQNVNTGTGADVSISLSADDNLFEQYETTVFTAIVRNDGLEATSEVEVFFPLPNQWKFTDASESKGEYNLFFETWYVGDLNPGEEATLELELFSKTEDGPVIVFTEVKNSSTDDPDSSPDNGNGVSANQDDEAIVTLTWIGNGVASLDRLFASSNNSGTVAVYDILEDNSLQLSTFPAEGMDADGIYYDENRDLLYQLNRTDNVINVYGQVNSAVNQGDTPPLVATSTADFINGREIAVTGGWLVVAQDANDVNNMTNKFYIYDISSTTPVLVKIYDANINLWGIHADADRLYVIEDNSNRLAFYDDFYNQPAGAIVPSGIISVEGIVRTHGLTYDFKNDIMYLTDVGAASSPDDGAFVVIDNFLEAASDNLISSAELRRISGENTLLGNPVDIAFSPVTGDIFVAERANGGGRILGFAGDAIGNVIPMFNELHAGASAVMIYSDQNINQGTGADVSLTLSTDNNLFEQYETTVFTAVVRNDGPESTSDVEVYFPLPNQWKFTDASESIGEYNLNFETWYVGDLDAGEEAMLELELFSKTENGPIVVFAEVRNSSTLDPDSTPDNGSGISANEDDEAIVTLTWIGNGGVTGGEGQADISLSIDGPTGDVDLYVPFTLNITLSNDGPDRATNLSVKLPKPSGLAYVADNTSDGDFNLFFNQWDVDDLDPGQSATLELTWFTKSESMISQYGQLFTVGQSDPDSAPGNGNGVSPNEDDEAVFTINVVNSASVDLPIFKNGPSVKELYPNPTISQLNMVLDAPEDGIFTMEIFNYGGKESLVRKLDLLEGQHLIDIDVSNFPSGV